MRVSSRCLVGFRDLRPWLVTMVLVGWSVGGCGSSSSSGAGGHPVGNGGSATAAGGKGGAGGTIGAGGKTALGGATGTGGVTPTGGRTAVGGAGATGAGGAGGHPAVSGDLGKACAADTDCTGGLTCLKATDKILDGLQGPANGYCSKACTSASDATCAALGGVCLGTTTNAAGDPANPYCFQTCTYGSPSGTSKCHGRTADVACVIFTEADATTAPPTDELDICFPVCTQDTDCPAGRKCDLKSNWCGDTASTGDPLGSSCTPDPTTGASNCAGGCLGLASSAGGTAAAAHICTMLCVLGSTGCSPAGTSLAGGPHGVCLLTQNVDTAQIGDFGYCVQECDTVADCSNKTDPGNMCDLTAMSAIGHGICSY